jgi:hypothetical protein
VWNAERCRAVAFRRIAPDLFCVGTVPLTVAASPLACPYNTA